MRNCLAFKALIFFLVHLWVSHSCLRCQIVYSVFEQQNDSQHLERNLGIKIIKSDKKFHLGNPSNILITAVDRVWYSFPSNKINVHSFVSLLMLIL